MRLTKRQLKRIIKEEKAKLLQEYGGYEGRYFSQHGTGKYSPDEQFNEDLHYILDTSPSERSYWKQAYEVIESLDPEERYMAEVIAERMWERHNESRY